jgi:hypothetical protein
MQSVTDFYGKMQTQFLIKSERLVRNLSKRLGIILTLGTETVFHLNPPRFTVLH